METRNINTTETYDIKNDGKVGDGGEGTVYGVKGHSEFVAKIYNPERLEHTFEDRNEHKKWNMQDKIMHMMARRVPTEVKEGTETVTAIAWPLDLLYERDGTKFLGFIMPRMDARVPDTDCLADLRFAYRERERKYLFKDGYTWLTSVRIARNLASVVRHLHSRDIIIGDFNCNNILIDAKGHVMLIDADSFSVSNPTLPITYSCVVGVPEFLAPEFQGQDLERTRRPFTKASDCFSLAIHVFELLMGGIHPFSGKVAGSENHSSTAIGEMSNEIAKGLCPYVTGSACEPFPGSLPMEMLPAYIRDLFDRTFSYGEEDATSMETISRRPVAEDWETALDRLYREASESTLRCPENPMHKSHPDSEICPWCLQEGHIVRLEEPREGIWVRIAKRIRRE